MSVRRPFCHRSPQRAIILASRADVGSSPSEQCYPLGECNTLVVILLFLGDFKYVK